MSDQTSFWSDICTFCLGNYRYNVEIGLYSSRILKQLVGHFVRAIPMMVRQCSLLVGKCPMSDHYFKHCYCADQNNNNKHIKHCYVYVNIMSTVSPCTVYHITCLCPQSQPIRLCLCTTVIQQQLIQSIPHMDKSDFMNW